jgi:hypothetical protein
MHIGGHMSNKRKIQKARDATLQHLRPKDDADDAPYAKASYTLSDASMQALDNIADHMQAAVEDISPSEKSSVPDEALLDPAFHGMSMPPNLGIASIARRKSIESRIAPIRVDDLFVSGEIRQKVEIRPGRLVIVFRTLKGKEDLYIKRRLNEVKDDVIRYAEDRFLYMLLCAHIHSYNGKVFSDIFEDGKISNIGFNKRFDELCDIPSILIEEIWVHFRWFEDRVKLALESDNLKSG